MIDVGAVSLGRRHAVQEQGCLVMRTGMLSALIAPRTLLAQKRLPATVASNRWEQDGHDRVAVTG